ncbi:hypothetical protein GCM10010124_28680 [Pilimelia terevasa]|uniref:Maleylpyruvate isomerase family mycothiol-dependent enzyme n=1 Tax=Pilimelia terevasa TaxID=53372 RepID=A0A8J3BTS9_9ACTN|nr:maleylpyruvate isomerase family mycothiol-dependent enzyme [Pilimelia terevasa]GGK34336.1 hypothetical protein GCM10010124_28680 [Pilimelia terevasa]
MSRDRGPLDNQPPGNQPPGGRPLAGRPPEDRPPAPDRPGDNGPGDNGLGRERLGHERYAAEIVAQTALLSGLVAAADPRVGVPSCPGWNLGQLARHLGGGQRWAAEILRTRATRPPPDRAFRDLSPYADEAAAPLAAWLDEGAAALARALVDTDPAEPLWTPVAGGTAGFYARRFAHETLVHRADAVLAVHEPFAAPADLARDALDEWMELGALPAMLDFHPHRRALLGPGRTLHLHADDGTPAGADWFVDLTGALMAHRRGGGPAAVSVRAPLTRLLLTVYGRTPARGHDVTVDGDGALLNRWLSTVGFG